MNFPTKYLGILSDVPATLKVSFFSALHTDENNTKIGVKKMPNLAGKATEFV